MAGQHRRHVRNSQDVKIEEETQINDQLCPLLLPPTSRLHSTHRTLLARFSAHSLDIPG